MKVGYFLSNKSNDFYLTTKNDHISVDTSFAAIVMDFHVNEILMVSYFVVCHEIMNFIVAVLPVSG